jgi:hypothetical protein
VLSSFTSPSPPSLLPLASGARDPAALGDGPATESAGAAGGASEATDIDVAAAAGEAALLIFERK